MMPDEQPRGAQRVPWLYHGSEALCPVTMARTPRERARGLLGRDGIDGALLLRPASWVHTFGMRFTLDVVHLDHDLRVLRMLTMPPQRMGRPVLRARAVLEARVGTLAALRPGDRLRLHPG